MSSTTINHSLDGQSQVTYIVSIISLACILSTAAVLLRIYTRLHILRTFGADDVVMGIAQLLTLGAAVAIGLESKWGLGRHIWVMLPQNYTPYMQSFYSSIIIYNVGNCVVKMSILLQYRRIFTGEIMRRVTLATLVFEGLWATTLAVLLPMVCYPVAKFWDSTLPGTCLDQLAIWYVMASINLVTDFFIFSMPLPVIRNLHLPRKQKIMLMGVFCLGFFTCAISVYRITTLKAAAESTDGTWENTDAAIWSLLELSIGVLAACLPTLRPLFARILPRLFKSTISGNTGKYQKYGMSGKLEGGSNAYSGGWPTGRSRTGPSNSKGGGTAVFGNDFDSDVEALRTDGSTTGSAGRDIELPVMYNVTVTAGKDRRDSDGHQSLAGAIVTPSNSVRGIQTTTVVTQRVDSL